MNKLFSAPATTSNTESQNILKKSLEYAKSAVLHITAMEEKRPGERFDFTSADYDNYRVFNSYTKGARKAVQVATVMLSSDLGLKKANMCDINNIMLDISSLFSPVTYSDLKNAKSILNKKDSKATGINTLATSILRYGITKPVFELESVTKEITLITQEINKGSFRTFLEEEVHAILWTLDRLARDGYLSVSSSILADLIRKREVANFLSALTTLGVIDKTGSYVVGWKSNTYYVNPEMISASEIETFELVDETHIKRFKSLSFSFYKYTSSEQETLTGIAQANLGDESSLLEGMARDLRISAQGYKMLESHLTHKLSDEASFLEDEATFERFGIYHKQALRKASETGVYVSWAEAEQTRIDSEMNQLAALFGAKWDGDTMVAI